MQPGGFWVLLIELKVGKRSLEVIWRCPHRELHISGVRCGMTSVSPGGLCVCSCVCTCYMLCVCTCGSPRKRCKNKFSTMWVQGSNLGLAVSTSPLSHLASPKLQLYNTGGGCECWMGPCQWSRGLLGVMAFLTDTISWFRLSYFFISQVFP